MSQHRDEVAPALPPEAADRSRRAFGLRSLLLLVVAAAAVLWCARMVRDAAVPAYSWLRLLRDGDDEQRREAASSLGEVKGSLRPQVAGALIAALRDPDVEVVAASARSLADVIEAEPDASIVRAWGVALAEGLSDPRPEVRKWSAFCMTSPRAPGAGRSSVAASDALAVALGDPSEDVRLAAASALGSAGMGETGLRALVKALENDPEPAVRLAAAPSLGIYVDGQDAATIALLNGLKSDRREIRSACDTVLWNMHSRGPARRTAAIVPDLIAAAADPRPTLRTHVAVALGDIGAAAVDAVPALVAMLAVPDDVDESATSLRSPDGGTSSPAARAAAALGLIAPGTQLEAEAAEAMLAALARPPADLAVQAALALGVSRFSDPFARRAVPGLAATLRLAAKSRSLLGRQRQLGAVCEELARLAPKSPAEAEAVEALSAALEIPWGDIPDAAAQALAEIGSGARPALPALRRLSQGPTERNQTAYHAAREAVRIIEGGP